MQAQENSATQGLIDQLQDIHSAAEPSLWPPAPGWWVLLFIALAVLVYLMMVLVRKLRIRLRRQRLLKELDGLTTRFDPQSQPAPYLAALNRVFRVVALKAFPETNCARLKGSEWVSFIRERLSANADLSGLEALESGPYEASPVYEPEQLRAYARQWVLKYG
ncbi:MAG TPA: DUF4381 domain-containing protein [Xanthomonadales bacterium]|nr:DUF4381 domain-containing protein [Xanthomonadales bacterium]